MKLKKTFQLEHLQHSFVPVQPDHPVIDASILQEGCAIISNQSAAFYKKTPNRSARSPGSEPITDFQPPLASFNLFLAPIFLTILIVPLLYVFSRFRRYRN